MRGDIVPLYLWRDHQCCPQRALAGCWHCVIVHCALLGVAECLSVFVLVGAQRPQRVLLRLPRWLCGLGRV